MADPRPQPHRQAPFRTCPPRHDDGSLHLAPTNVKDEIQPLGPLEDGAELARFVFSSPQPEVDVQFRPMFSMSLGNRPFAPSATLDMEHMVTCLRDTVLPRFERFF